MSASPLACLRGSAPLFYEILAARPELATGPAGVGWTVGDMHLENFGAYQTGKRGDDTATDASAKGDKGSLAVRFDVNDFDDAVVGPWRFDVLRLTTSLLLGRRELGMTGVTGLTALELCDDLLDAWSSSAFGGALAPPRSPPPAPIATLLEEVRTRTKASLLDDRTELLKSGTRRFVRGARYAELPSSVAAAVPEAFKGYLESIPEEERPRGGSLEIVDSAWRIAGTGSLGALRLAVLVKGKGGPDGGWIFDLKEEADPSASALVARPSMTPGERVCKAFRTCVERAPRMLGSTTLRVRGDTSGRSMFGRRLAPQEDKLNLRRLKPSELPAVVRAFGACLGAAHRRGATKRPRRWSASDFELLRSHAVTLAGIHEAVYLAMCEQMRPLLKNK